MINILKLKGKIVEAGMNISSLSRELKWIGLHFIGN